MQFSKEILKGSAEVIVLQALHDSDAYGYELVERIARTSENIFEFQEGTLYPLLYRLEDRALVTSYSKQAPSGKERRYYQITKEGDAFLRSRTKELSTFITGLRKALRFSVE